MKFFDEEFYVVHCPGCCSYDVLESSALPFCKRVVLVLGDIIYIINILYL
jgi:hypothetical protein